jgi:hypothetical protein
MGAVDDDLASVLASDCCELFNRLNQCRLQIDTKIIQGKTPAFEYCCTMELMWENKQNLTFDTFSKVFRTESISC